MGSYIVRLLSDCDAEPMPELPELMSSPEGPNDGTPIRKVFATLIGVVSLLHWLLVIL